MKNTFFIIIASIFVFSCNSNSTNEDIQKEKNPYMVTKVKEERTYSYSYKFGSLDSSSKELERIKFYDTNGRLIKEIWYHQTFEKENDDLFSDYKEILDSTTYLIKYNTDGNKTTFEHINRYGKLESKTEYFYKNNLLDNLTSYDSTGRLESKVIYEYDGENINHMKEYDNIGKLIGVTNYFYKNGIEIKFESFKNDTLFEKDTLIEDKSKNDRLFSCYSSYMPNWAKRHETKIGDTLGITTYYDKNNIEIVRIVKKLSKGLIINYVYFTNKEPMSAKISYFTYYN